MKIKDIISELDLNKKVSFKKGKRNFLVIEDDIEETNSEYQNLEKSKKKKIEDKNIYKTYTLFLNNDILLTKRSIHKIIAEINDYV